MSRWRARTRSLVATAAATFCVAGCAGPQGGPAPSPQPVRQTLGADDVISPAVRGARNGLEVMGWLVADVNRGLVEEALAAYAAEPVPMEEKVRERWRRSGLRLFRVPLDELGALREQLPLVGRAERRWLGQATEWTTVFEGGFVDRSSLLWIDRGPVRLEGGRLRLLARSFTIPEAGGPCLWTEVAVQLAEAGVSEPFRRPSLRRPEEDGLVFRGLTAEMPLSTGFAYLLFEASPDATFGEEQEMEEAVGPSTPAGPPTPRLARLGERLMHARSGEAVVRSAYGSGSGVRRLVAFVPRAPTRYTLLP